MAPMAPVGEGQRFCLRRALALAAGFAVAAASSEEQVTLRPPPGSVKAAAADVGGLRDGEGAAVPVASLKEVVQLWGDSDDCGCDCSFANEEACEVYHDSGDECKECCCREPQNEERDWTPWLIPLVLCLAAACLIVVCCLQKPPKPPPIPLKPPRKCCDAPKMPSCALPECAAPKMPSCAAPKMPSCAAPKTPECCGKREVHYVPDPPKDTTPCLVLAAALFCMALVILLMLITGTEPCGIFSACPEEVHRYYAQSNLQPGYIPNPQPEYIQHV